MKTDASPIARIELARISSNGERVPLVVEIGQPLQNANGFWRTPVALHGLDGRLCDIYGEDSLQSLCLALELVRRRLMSVTDNGERLVNLEGDDFQFDVYFTRPPSGEPPPPSDCQ
jgi:hypothetical protein